jgi:hypothetical protein
MEVALVVCEGVRPCKRAILRVSLWVSESD